MREDVPYDNILLDRCNTFWPTIVAGECDMHLTLSALAWHIGRPKGVIVRYDLMHFIETLGIFVSGHVLSKI